MANTNSWPDLWNGDLNDNYPVDVGGLIGTMSIPNIEAFNEKILEFQWNDVPNPTLYEDVFDYYDQHEFSFLARIVSSDDPMAVEETYPDSDRGNVWVNTNNNNNIAWKNIIVNDAASINSLTSVVNISNLDENTKNYSLEFFMEETEIGKPIFE